jgi:hypothetical protein
VVARGTRAAGGDPGDRVFQLREAVGYLARTATGEWDTLIWRAPVSAKPIMARAPISMQIVINWLLRSLIA